MTLSQTSFFFNVWLQTIYDIICSRQVLKLKFSDVEIRNIIGEPKRQKSKINIFDTDVTPRYTTVCDFSNFEVDPGLAPSLNLREVWSENWKQNLKKNLDCGPDSRSSSSSRLWNLVRFWINVAAHQVLPENYFEYKATACDKFATTASPRSHAVMQNIMKIEIISHFF